METYKMIKAGEESTITETEAQEIIGAENFAVAKEGLSWQQDDVEIFFSLTEYLNNLDKQFPPRLRIKREDIDWKKDGIHGHYFDPILNAHHNVCVNGCCEDALHLTYLKR